MLEIKKTTHFSNFPLETIAMKWMHLGNSPFSSTIGRDQEQLKQLCVFLLPCCKLEKYIAGCLEGEGHFACSLSFGNRTVSKESEIAYIF